VVVFILTIIRGIEVGEALRFVMALAVSAVPESLPIAITVILVLGMRRMAAKKALVRTMRSIETIGVITTIATDKTGTLTENKLSVQETWQPNDAGGDLSAAVLLSINRNDGKSRDPLDIAMTGFISKNKGLSTKHELISKLPFDQSVSMSGSVWNSGKKITVAVKGAPEQVMSRCKLSKAAQEDIDAAVKQFAGEGYRVIALASAELTEPIDSFKDLPNKTVFEF